MAHQFGGSRMGGVSLQAGTEALQNFNNLSKGPVAKFLLTLAFTLRNAANAASTLVVSTAASAAAEGVDDLDIILNALMTRLTLFWDTDSMAGSLTPAQWRTILGIFNQRDFDGSLLNGATIPASGSSAAAFSVVVLIPINMDLYFDDGTIFSAGSVRLRDGNFGFLMGASLTPACVLANCTANVGAVVITVNPEHGGGTEGDVGFLWMARRNTGLANPYEFPDNLFYLLVADTQTASANTGSGITAGNYVMWNPPQFQAKYQGERLRAGGFDATARCTPYLWLQQNRKFLDFLADLGRTMRVDIASGTTLNSLYVVTALKPSPALASAVASVIGSGGPTHLEHVAPPSLPPGFVPPPEMLAWLPKRIKPGNAPAGSPGSNVPNPAAVGARIGAEAQVHNDKSARFRFGRKG